MILFAVMGSIIPPEHTLVSLAVLIGIYLNGVCIIMVKLPGLTK